MSVPFKVTIRGRTVIVPFDLWDGEAASAKVACGGRPMFNGEAKEGELLFDGWRVPGLYECELTGEARMRLF